MSSYHKPTKLVSLAFYSPFEPSGKTQRLISRDKNRMTSQFYGEKEINLGHTQPLMNTCVRSFNWMYRSPGYRSTSFHIEQQIGKDRKIKLPALKTTTKPILNNKSASVKTIITRKPTINMRKSLDFQQNSGFLSEKIAKGSLIFSSAVLKKGNETIVLPFNSLKNIIFAAEGEVINNLSRCLEDLNFETNSNFYSNFEEISESFDYPYFVPSLQTTIFIINSKAIFSRNLGKIIKTFENKGLLLKLSKLVQISGPCLITAWEGSESDTVIRNIANSINPDFFEFASQETLSNYLTQEDFFLIHKSQVPVIACQIHDELIKFTYPSITYTVTSETSAVPLGLLKNFMLTNFEDWSEKWVKKYEQHFGHRRAGFETSTLKANVCVKENPCVLTLNSFEIQISNNELEASFAFKISDMEFIYKNSGMDLVKNLMKTAKLEEKTVKNRKVWDLVVNVDKIPKSVGEVQKESKVKIDGKEFFVKFTMPWVELYKAHTEETLLHSLSHIDIEKLIDSNFQDWENSLLRYFPS